jgi:uncharacterized protein DUF3224
VTKLQPIVRNLFALMMVFGLVGQAHTARAAQPEPASGSWTDCNIVEQVRTVGSVTMVIVTITEQYTGSLSGSYVGTEWDIIRADGSATFIGQGVFTGSVGQQTGSAQMRYAGTASASGAALAHWEMSNGSGDLARVHGQGTFEGTALDPTPQCAIPYGGTYAGEIHFGG